MRVSAELKRQDPDEEWGLFASFYFLFRIGPLLQRIEDLQGDVGPYSVVLFFSHVSFSICKP